MTTPDTIVSAILATLATTAPQLSCAPGTPERQIIEAVAAQISAAYIGQYLTGGMMDINTKSGLELDQFVGIFGFGRLQGTAASGVISMTMTAVPTAAISVPLGSQFYNTPGLAGLSTTLFFSSTQAVTIPAGSSQVSIPVQCTTVGTSGNVPPDSVTSQSAAIGSSVVTNTAAFTGGTNVETDAQLRQRFMDTLLRNISGTSDWYINTALQNNYVARAAVYGPVSLYSTQIAVPESSVTLSNLSSNVGYVWPGGTSCFTGIGTDSETFYSPIDDFTLTADVPPTFEVVDGSALVTGQIVDLEFQYTTASSRNSPGTGGPTNKVDVFIDGSAPFMVTETCIVTSQTFSATSTDPLYFENFERVDTGAFPTQTNRFMRLGSVPILNFPSSITVGPDTYEEGTHYYLLQGTTKLKGSQLEVAGLEWISAGAANSSQLTLNYTYNQAPQLLDAIMASSKQICTDILTHVADYQYITTNLTIEYSRNYAISTVNTAVVARLQIFYQTLGFAGVVIISQLEAAVQQVLGVNEVHVTTQDEAVAAFGADSLLYGIWQVDNSADVTPTVEQINITDFVLLDNQLAVYQNTNTLQAPNIGGGGS
jgi:uncharacterized phage protein gp47/JayE